MEEYKIRTNEAISLMINLFCNKLFVIAPIYLKQAAGNAIIISIIVFYFLIFVIWNLLSKFQPTGKDLLDIRKNILVKYLIGCIISLSIFVVVTLTLRQYGEGLKVMALQKSPITFIITILSVAMIFGARCGLKSIAKSNSFFVPIIYIVALFLAYASLNYSDLLNIFPVFGKGLTNIVSKSLIMLSMLFEIIVLFMFPPILEKPEDLKKIGNYSLIWSFVCFLIIAGIYCISTPTNLNLNYYEPFFRLIKQIGFGNLLHRFDSFFLILYCISAFLYLSSMLYFISHILAKTFQIKQPKMLIMPVGLLITTLSFANILEEYMFNIVEKSNYVLWIVSILIPLIIITLSKPRSLR